jgi:hypothetical protein
MDKQLAQHRTQEQGSRIAAAAHLNYEFVELSRRCSSAEQGHPGLARRSDGEQRRRRAPNQDDLSIPSLGWECYFGFGSGTNIRIRSLDEPMATIRPEP